MKKVKGSRAQSGASPKVDDLNNQNSVTLSGLRVLEFHRILRDPDGHKHDWLLLRAKRCATKAKAGCLEDAELRAVAWFAFLPDIEGDGTALSEERRGEVVGDVLDKDNHSTWIFLDLWLRKPAVVTRLLVALRDKARDPETMQAEEEYLTHSHKLPVRGIDKATNAKRQRVKVARKLTEPDKALLEGAKPWTGKNRKLVKLKG